MEAMLAQPIGDSAIFFEAMRFLDYENIPQSSHEVEDIWIFPFVILARIRQILQDVPLARQVILLAWNAAHVNCNDVSLLPVTGIKDLSIPGGSHRTQSLVAES